MKIETLDLDYFKKTVVMQFDSLEEHIQYAKEWKRQHHGNRDMEKETIERPEWVGRKFKSGADIFAQARTKDDAILRLCEENANLVDDTEVPLTLKRKRVHARRGRLDVRGYIRQSEHPWTKLESREKTGPKLVSLVIPISSSASYDAQEIAWKTVSIMLLSEKLENAGYAVSIYFLSATTGMYTNGWSNIKLIRVKDSSEELNLATLSAGLSPWYFRSVCFMGFYREGLVCESCLGMPYREKAAKLENILSQFVSDPIVVEQSYSKEDCIKNVNQVIKRLGVDE